jgi:hypothetical protein
MVCIIDSSNAQQKHIFIFCTMGKRAFRFIVDSETLMSEKKIKLVYIPSDL